MGTRMKIDQLEQMKTHELADLLASVVLLLRRMPNVACKELFEQVPDHNGLEQPEIVHALLPSPSFTREELGKKKVDELKKLAKELHVRSSSTRKDDLINKILARRPDGHSEQRAIQDL